MDQPPLPDLARALSGAPDAAAAAAVSAATGSAVGQPGFFARTVAALRSLDEGLNGTRPKPDATAVDGGLVELYVRTIAALKSLEEGINGTPPQRATEPARAPARGPMLEGRSDVPRPVPVDRLDADWGRQIRATIVSFAGFAPIDDRVGGYTSASFGGTAIGSRRDVPRSVGVRHLSVLAAAHTRVLAALASADRRPVLMSSLLAIAAVVFGLSTAPRPDRDVDTLAVDRTPTETRPQYADAIVVAPPSRIPDTVVGDTAAGYALGAPPPAVAPPSQHRIIGIAPAPPPAAVPPRAAAALDVAAIAPPARELTAVTPPAPLDTGAAPANPSTSAVDASADTGQLAAIPLPGYAAATREQCAAPPGLFATTAEKTDPRRLPPLPRPDEIGPMLASAARAQVQEFVFYDERYRRISYPMGDVDQFYGVCTDVVIRAYRTIGIDLQYAVQASGVGSGDTNVDHRRTETLRRFFAKHGESLPVSGFAEDYLPGDIVTYYRPQNSGSRSHIAVVSDVVAPSGRYMIVHNRGWGPQLEDGLFVDEITGHYRYRGDGPHRPPASDLVASARPPVRPSLIQPASVAAQRPIAASRAGRPPGSSTANATVTTSSAKLTREASLPPPSPVRATPVRLPIAQEPPERPTRVVSRRTIPRGGEFEPRPDFGLGR